MSFIPRIICRNCGKKFSAIRGRCPACGARHVKQTMRTAPAASVSANGPQAAANARWQLIFGGILVAAVIVAVIILITASLDPAVSGEPVDMPPPVDVTTPQPPTPTPTPTPSPTVPVSSLTIMYLGSQVPDSFTQRTDWAPLPLSVDIYPREALATATVTWRSSDTSVAIVDETGLLTSVGSGKCNITAECGGVTATCEVLVP